MGDLTDNPGVRPLRISEHYNLGVNQPVLEFLDVDLEADTKVFVDPFAFRFIDTPWANEAVSLLQDFYGEVLHAVQHRDERRAVTLMSQLGEPNEAHLGLSQGESRGSGVAGGLAHTLYDAFASSDAVASGLVEDLEESILFVDNIGHDRLSDMTINIVREPLISFTQQMADQYDIELVPGLNSGPMWNRHSHMWVAEHVELPMPRSKLLLIPKAVVRKSGTFDPGEYLQHFVLPYLQHRELSLLNSPLVQQRAPKRGRPGEFYVTKKSLRDQRGGARGENSAKPWNTEVTAQRPELLEQYRRAASAKTEPPSHETIALATDTPLPDWEDLLRAVREIPAGPAGANAYHRAVQHLLDALFYPALTTPRREFRTHDGRKRLDIMYANQAQTGFFKWIRDSQHVPSGQVVVECKNYSGPLSNPEFDQLTGRFSPARGQLGLLCYRGFADTKASVLQHCRDAALDQRGFVIALDDEDLFRLVESRDASGETQFEFLLERFNELI